MMYYYADTLEQPVVRNVSENEDVWVPGVLESGAVKAPPSCRDDSSNARLVNCRQDGFYQNIRNGKIDPKQDGTHSSFQ
jgi:hypothetical protein